MGRRPSSLMLLVAFFAAGGGGGGGEGGCGVCAAAAAGSNSSGSSTNSNGGSGRSYSAEYFTIPGYGRYKINANYKTWEAAKRTCENEGSHLAVMDSEEEMDSVINMLVRCGLEYTRFDFWTGYFREDSTGQWTTVLGWPVGGSGSGYTGWMSGYPNGVRDAACSRLLVTINARGLINGDCTNVGPFLCEKDL